MAFITPADLSQFATIDAAKAAAMIADAESMAILDAPCLPGLLTAPEDETPEAEALRLAKLNAVKAILRGAILRWEDAGSGALQTQQEQTGPFGVQTTVAPQVRKSMFWPSELEQLQGICSTGEKGSAFTLDTAPGGGDSATAFLHTPWCSYRFGATYCSCGVDLSGFPMFEVLEENP
jgi:hypothetical protein